jgi:ribA/ribD-fused uncharacterized protein
MPSINFWGSYNANGYLSNFYRAKMVVDGKEYPTNEHFFQSQKFVGTEHELDIISLETPALTAREGKRRDLPLRKDWEEVRERIMYRGLKAKFTQNPELLVKLLATDNNMLVEVSPVDYYWGVGRKGTGKNRLGKLLMELRGELRGDSK